MVEETPELFEKVIELEMDFGEDNGECWVFYWAAKYSNNYLEINSPITSLRRR